MRAGQKQWRNADMKQFMIYLMIYAGSALMAYNIYRYTLFSREVRKNGNGDLERGFFRVPILLLILFLVGYLAIGIFGDPDLIIASILFGGSIFVFVMLQFVRRTVKKIQENEQLEAKLSVAEEANKAKSVFLSNMSHDIRTPLNAIIGYTTLASGEHVTSDEKTEYIHKIENAGRQLLDIINDVLEMSRIESGKLVLEPECVNLEDCIYEAADLVRTQLSLKNIDFTVFCDIRHKWVRCDKNLLNRALINLLCNAGKFTDEEGSVSLQLTELSESDETSCYTIRVKDTGIGMSPEFVERLFTPFEREKTSTVSKIQGTGLGMAITKSILDLMGGTIEVHTEQGKGTEFILTISFPLEEPEEKTPVKTNITNFDGIRTLLVEDNAINMEIAQMILTQVGMRVDTAENGQIAVDMVVASEPGYYDLILMDIQMPVMDGYTAARAIRELENRSLASIPIIAMTANAFKEDVKAAEEAGMQGHIAKPIDIDAMMQTVSKVLSGGR